MLYRKPSESEPAMSYEANVVQPASSGSNGIRITQRRRQKRDFKGMADLDGALRKRKRSTGAGRNST